MAGVPNLIVRRTFEVRLLLFFRDISTVILMVLIPYRLEYFRLRRIGSVPISRNHTVAYTQYMNWNKDAIFKALGDSTRRLILDELSERNELTLYELTIRLITKYDLSITRQAIAKHLSVLEDAGLVTSKRKGKYRVLIFNNEPLKNLLKGWIE